jgi:predicted dehydrogenase
MATSSRDCDAMIDACDRAAVRLMIAYPLHFDPANLRAIEIVRSGKLGEPRYFTASFSQQVRDGDGDVRTRADLAGGALFDMGIYGINAARLLFGAEPTAVVGFQARATDDRFHDVDAMTTALMHFSDDRLAHVVASHGAADVDSMRIVGTRGELRVEPAFGYAGQLKHYLTIGSRTQETTFRTGDRFAPELVHFSECLRCGAEPQPSGREGLADVRVMEALIRSAHDGRLVELAAFDPGARPEVRLEMKKPAVKPPPTARAPSPSR